MQLNRGLLGGSENLASITFTSGSVGSYNSFVFSQNSITLKANETYTLSFYCENFVRNGVYLNESFFIQGDTISDSNYFDNLNSDGRTTYDNNILRKTFTCITDITITSGSTLVKNAGTATTYNAKNGMLNKGTTALPYKKRSGNIVFEADLEPTLLWENSNSNTTFASQTITVSDMSSFKYIVVTYRDYTSLNGGAMSKIIYGVGNRGGIFTVSDNYLGRNFNIASSTTINFGNCYVSGSVSNDYLIPIAIYGTNIL